MNLQSRRTCIGCRQRDEVTALARLCMFDGQVIVATGGTRGRSLGRGASLHPRAACVQKAVASGAFSRAFRARALPSTETVVALSGTQTTEHRHEAYADQAGIQGRSNREQP